MVLEYADGGDLATLILNTKNRGDHLREEPIWKLFLPIMQVAEYLHDKGIIHRDFKALNVFLTANKDIKVGDFGVGRVLSNDTLMVDTMYGTPLYISPELCKNEPYNAKTDMWSCGVLLYELCALDTPFPGRNLVELSKNICAGNMKPVPGRYSKLMQRAVTALLEQDQSIRPSAKRFLDWYAMAREKIREAENVGGGRGGGGHAEKDMEKPRKEYREEGTREKDGGQQGGGREREEQRKNADRDAGRERDRGADEAAILNQRQNGRQDKHEWNGRLDARKDERAEVRKDERAEVSTDERREQRQRQDNHERNGRVDVRKDERREQREEVRKDERREQRDVDVRKDERRGQREQDSGRHPQRVKDAGEKGGRCDEEERRGVRGGSEVGRDKGAVGGGRESAVAERRGREGPGREVPALTPGKEDKPHMFTRVMSDPGTPPKCYSKELVRQPKMSAGSKIHDMPERGGDVGAARGGDVGAARGGDMGAARGGDLGAARSSGLLPRDRRAVEERVDNKRNEVAVAGAGVPPFKDWKCGGGAWEDRPGSSGSAASASAASSASQRDALLSGVCARPSIYTYSHELKLILLYSCTHTR